LLDFDFEESLFHKFDSGEIEARKGGEPRAEGGLVLVAGSSAMGWWLSRVSLLTGCTNMASTMAPNCRRSKKLQSSGQSCRA